MIDANEFRKKAPVERDWIMYCELQKLREDIPAGAYNKREKTVNWLSLIMALGSGVGTIIVAWLNRYTNY
jgi:hypothetical protein